ncbi:MAG: hypothetical protein PHX25_00240 [Candidatus Pacebacteria bacterium]|nr:hypothetical protein [Candidatus Paceibacterota bacterium]
MSKKQSIKKKCHSDSDFKIDLDKIPNWRRKPVEVAEFIKKMREWRETSTRSHIVIY